MKKENKKNFLNLVTFRNTIIFVLIFGNIIFNKLYASIKIGEIFYINEILLFLLYLTIEKKFHSGFKYFLLLLPFPLISILIFEYEIYNVFKDYAIFYYPFVIYILVTKNIEIKNSVNFVISKTKFIYPYLPLYFSIYYVFTKRPFRATEAVCFSIILYFYAKLETEDTYKYFEDYLFYSFMFFLALQHRSSILTVTILIGYLVTKKIQLKSVLIILLSAITCYSLYIFVDKSEFISLERGINEIENRSQELLISTNCEIDNSLAIEKYLEINKLNKENFPENYFKLFCGWTNIEWRIEIWSSVLDELRPVKDNLVINTLGEDLILRGVENKNIPEYMVFNSLNKLRNAHNTFLTFLARFGFVPFVFMSIFLTYLFFRNYFNYLYLFLPFVQTFFDPILDGPVLAIPFYFIFFSTLIYKKY